jgi:hypothetical protein
LAFFNSQYIHVVSLQVYKVKEGYLPTEEGGRKRKKEKFVNSPLSKETRILLIMYRDGATEQVCFSM